MVTIYLVRPDVETTWDVVHSYSEASQWVDTASELAELAGDKLRAQRIQDVWLRLYGRSPMVLYPPEIEQMLDLLDGLETTLIGRVVDEKWRIRSEQLPELRERTTTIDLDEKRGTAVLHAVGEAMSGVVALRKIFQIAKDKGLLVGVA